MHFSHVLSQSQGIQPLDLVSKVRKITQKMMQDFDVRSTEEVIQTFPDVLSSSQSAQMHMHVWM